MKYTVEQWRRDVFRSRLKAMTPAVKVLCLYLAQHMTPDRKVEIDRSTMATDLGIHKARIAERLNGALEAQFLTSVSAPAPRRPAIYQGLRPSLVEAGNASSTAGRVQQSRTRPEEPDALSLRSAGRVESDTHAETRPAAQDASTTATSHACGTDHAEFRDITCQWHPFAACPSDCANAGRSEAETA